MPLYSHEFQREVLYTLANNTKFATQYGSYIRESSFDLAPMKTLYTLINKHMLLYERELERKDLLILAEDHVNQKGWGSESLKVFKDEISDIYTSKPKNEEFVINKTIQFVQQQELKIAIEDSIKILEKSDGYEGVLKLIDKALSIGAGAIETKTMKDIQNLPELYRDRYDPKKLIRTGISQFDKALMGGMAPGELHVFIGPPGSGKSTFGCNIGSYNVLQGKKVFHATLEIKDFDVLKHYALRFTGLSHVEFLTVTNEIWEKKMERVRKLQDNNLFVAYWPGLTATALTIRSWVAQQRSLWDVNPDLIIIDYDDCLSPVSGASGEMYDDAGNVYDELIQLAEYFKCFPGDTEIMTNGFPVRFDQLKKNDTIAIKCLHDGVLREVTAIALGEIGKASRLMKITFAPGEYDGTSTIRCTLDHKIMTVDHGKMVEAQNLKVGDTVVSINSYANRFKSSKVITAIEVEVLPQPVPVYCLHVPVIGNFALGNGVVVSNCPVVTFAQPRRDAWDLPDDEVIRSFHLAHSAKKAHKAYSVSSLNFKKGATTGKLYIDKCRRGVDDVFITMERNLAYSYFGEKKDVLYEDDKGNPVEPPPRDERPSERSERPERKKSSYRGRKAQGK
jgi:RecA/RadA recombinase